MLFESVKKERNLSPSGDCKLLAKESSNSTEATALKFINEKRLNIPSRLMLGRSAMFPKKDNPSTSEHTYFYFYFSVMTAFNSHTRKSIAWCRSIKEGGKQKLWSVSTAR